MDFDITLVVSFGGVTKKMLVSTKDLCLSFANFELRRKFSVNQNETFELEYIDEQNKKISLSMEDEDEWKALRQEILESKLRKLEFYMKRGPQESKNVPMLRFGNEAVPEKRRGEQYCKWTLVLEPVGNVR